VDGPIFITGVTGYIGSRVLRRLLAGGVEVRTVVRSYADQRRLEAEGVGFPQLGSVELFAPMRQAIHTARVAIHLAGILKEERGGRFRHVNEAAGRMFARVANEQGVDRAILVTCIGEGATGRLASQRAAEVALRESGVPYTILRLAPVFGEGSRWNSWFAGLGRSSLPATGAARWQPIDVEDATDAIIRAAFGEAAANEAIELGGPDAGTLREIAARFGSTPDWGAPTRSPGLLAGLRGGTDDRSLPMSPEDLEISAVPAGDGIATLGLDPRGLRQALP